MLGQLPRQDQSYGSLNLTGGDGGLLVIACEPRRFLSQLLEDVVDEAVHNTHGFAGNADIRMDLLQHLEDVDLVGFNALLASLLLLVPGFFRELLLGSWFFSQLGPSRPFSPQLAFSRLASSRLWVPFETSCGF